MAAQRISLAQLPAALRKEMRGAQDKVQRALRETAREGQRIARENVPKASRELADGIEVEASPRGVNIRSTAPHSDAVDRGSRPHMPPVEPIAEWVRRRGLEGLTEGGKLKRMNSTGRTVARMIKAHGDGSSVAIDAPMRVAWAIAKKIAKSGTEPTFFMLRTYQQLQPVLDRNMKAALRGK